MTKSLLACVALVFASPDPGQEAVLVRKPWLFGHGGVEGTPVKTGLLGGRHDTGLVRDHRADAVHRALR